MPSALKMLEEALPAAAAGVATRMQRAEAMGFDTAKIFYHATPANFREFKAGEDSLIHFGTAEQANARSLTFGKSFGPEGSAEGAASIIPAFLKVNNPVRVKDYGFFDSHKIARELETSGVLSAAESEKIRSLKFEADSMGKLKETLKAKGYDAFVYKNANETLESSAPLVDSIAVFDPSQVRSVNATFNPAEKESGNLLAGVAGATALGVAATAGRSAEASDLPTPLAEAYREGAAHFSAPGSDVSTEIVAPKPQVTRSVVDEMIARSLGHTLPGSSVLNYIASGRTVEAGAEPSVGVDDMLSSIFPMGGVSGGLTR